jgi:hypothetical protein
MLRRPGRFNNKHMAEAQGYPTQKQEHFDLSINIWIQQPDMGCGIFIPTTDILGIQYINVLLGT